MRVERVTVFPEAVEARVVFTPPDELRVSAYPHAGLRVMKLLPGLRGHRCDNGDGRPFGVELLDTEVAHLFEHAALEIMAMAGSPTTLRGTTSWDFATDGRGVFVVRIAYDDDLVALGALKAAEDVVRWALSGEGAAPDVEAEAHRLKGLRTR